MTPYTIVLFAHVVGALGLFAALALEWTSLRRLRGATTTEQAREWLGAVRLVRVVGPASLAAVLVTGLYMAATAWGAAPWIVVALGAMASLPPLGALNGLRLAAIRRKLAPESGPLSPAARRRLREPLLWTSVHVRSAILLGIVFLMTAKPDTGGALLAIATAVALGLLASGPAWAPGARATAPA